MAVRIATRRVSTWLLSRCSNGKVSIPTGYPTGNTQGGMECSEIAKTSITARRRVDRCKTMQSRKPRANKFGRGLSRNLVRYDRDRGAHRVLLKWREVIGTCDKGCGVRGCVCARSVAGSVVGFGSQSAERGGQNVANKSRFQICTADQTAKEIP